MHCAHIIAPLSYVFRLRYDSSCLLLMVSGIAKCSSRAIAEPSCCCHRFSPLLVKFAFRDGRKQPIHRIFKRFQGENVESYFVGAFAYSAGYSARYGAAASALLRSCRRRTKRESSAQRLHVSRPPLSRQIRDLEAELGLALFEHSAKAIRLTEAGKIFLLEARAVLQRAEDAVALTKSVANQKRGQVHVGYSMPASGEILPRALRAFQRANPQARVDLHMMPWQRCFAHFAPGIWMFPSRCILSQRIFKD